MNKLNTHFFLLLITLLFFSSCGNSNKTNLKETPSEVTQTDDYATLRVSNAPQEMTENISGNVITLSEKDFIEQITTIDNPKGFRYLGKTPCIVELYADWCKPCWILSDLMIELAPEYKGKVIFYKLNIDRAPNIVKAFNVENIPMILYFKPREKVANTVGLLNKGNLRKAINDLLLND